LGVFEPNRLNKAIEIEQKNLKLVLIDLVKDEDNLKINLKIMK